MSEEGHNNTVADWVEFFAESAVDPSPLIPDVGRWAEWTLPKIAFTYDVTQFMAVYWCFQLYLQRMGKSPSPKCMHCPCISDSVEHTMFQCPRWDLVRLEIHTHLGRPLTTTDMPELLYGPALDNLPIDEAEKTMTLLDAEESYRLFYRMVETIMFSKQDEERLRQCQERLNRPVSKVPQTTTLHSNSKATREAHVITTAIINNKVTTLLLI